VLSDPFLSQHFRVSNKSRIALFEVEMAELHSNLHKSLHFTRLERIDGIAHSHNQKVETMTHIFFPIVVIGK